MTRRIAVVGAGITGLVAADTIVAADPTAEVTVFEASPRAGGKVHTTNLAGVALDEGPDAFLARVPAGRELAERLGLGDELVSPAQRSARLWIDGALRPIPMPMALGIPLDPETLAASGTVSRAAVAALEADLARTDSPPLGPHDDVSVGAFIRERLGDEILERLVDPLLGGINAGSCDALSLVAAAPTIADAARQGGSLTRVLDERRLAAASTDPSAPVFFALPGGLGRLVDRLLDRLGDRVKLASPVEALHPRDDGVELLVAGDRHHADHVVLTAPARAMSPLLSSVSAPAARALADIEYASVVLVSLAFDRDDVPTAMDASGFLVPVDQPPEVTACSWASSKWAHLDAGPVILRVSLGRHGADDVIDATDDDVLAVVARDLRTTMGIGAEPVDVRISRWRNGFPQYTVGHLARVAAVEAALVGTPISVAGASYRGIGLPACIDQARSAVARLV